MKKYGIGRRGLTLLLVLAMIVSMIPNTWAAVGDMATGESAGKTGLTGNINTHDTISWPIKIYDYLNDGMLFEYANAGDSGDIADALGGAYGGGTPAPQFSGADSVIGNDYTVSDAYTEDAYTSNFASSAYWYTGSKIEAKNFVDPMHLRVVLDDGYSPAPVVLSNFGADNSTYYSKSEVQYAVIAYRTNGLSDSTIQLKWNLSTGNSYSGSAQIFKASADWTYVVYEMKTGDINTNWSKISGDVVDEVAFTFPLTSGSSTAPTSSYNGQYIDISHIAYFDTKFEAIEFGKDAVAFDNDPGEFLDSHTEYLTGQYANPGVSSNGLDFTTAGSASWNKSIYTDWSSSLGMTTGMGASSIPYYMTVTNADPDDPDMCPIWHPGTYASTASGNGVSVIRYITIVYRVHGIEKPQIGFWLNDTGYSNCIVGKDGQYRVDLPTAEDESQWLAFTFDLEWLKSQFKLSFTGKVVTFNEIGIMFPGFTSDNQSMDIAFVDFFSNATDASQFGTNALNYMNDPKGTFITAQKKWNTGNNVAFSMLYANQGGGWVSDGTSRGGTNTEPNGYFSYQIGLTYPSSEDTLGQNDDRQTAKKNGYTVSDYIYLVNGSNVTEPFDTTVLDFGGYGLFNTFNSGVYTAGLLNATLTTVTGTDGKTYRVPDYKEETVEYIAALLRDALRIAQTDASGNYNYNFVRGTANGEQYGYDDNGKAMDLASALRKELNVVLPVNGGKAGSGYAALGDYAKLTDADKAGLIGEFAQVKGNINTFVDAAYFLLMNLYVGNSYNQEQDEYSYLVLSNGMVNNGTTDTSDDKSAYIFDGGFTTGVAANTANTEAYRNSSQSAIVYDKDLGTISMSSGLSKDQVYFEGSSATTRFPFLPVTDSEGIYAGETKSPYFLDDGRGVMGVTEEGATFVNRNYNFSLASNGEFVYHYDEDLFFEFEGDDDVYLFINGELVLDIGGAHSITKVGLNVNDYVDWARKVTANPTAYSADEVARAKKLNLKDGEKYTFDFYYMERHGWGSNCRIATNIVVTDPALDTNKQGYQGTDVNGDPVEVPYGGIIDITDRIGYSFAITNNGDTKLYKLSFMDADIGLNLTYDGDLIVYGRPTVATVTNGASGIKVTGLNGVVDVDGDNYSFTEDGTCTWTEVTENADGTVSTEVKTGNAIPATAGTHTLTLYQMFQASDMTKEMLFDNANVTITANSTQNVSVAGIRVTDKNGDVLDVSDLTITVDGYASEEKFNAGEPMDTLKISLDTEAELMQFLRTLKDPDDKTDDTPTDDTNTNMYTGEGLWKNATVKISGFYYTMTEEEQKANVFGNTVYSYGYKHKNATAPIKSQDRHRVYGLGSYAYYQWASNTVHLDFETMWTDVLGVFSSPDESLYEQRDQINALNAADHDTLQVEVVDKNGTPLMDTYNLYANGTWGTYEGDFKPNTRYGYFFKNVEDWNKDWTSVYVYYWSNNNTGMTTWPGEQMQKLDDGTWYYELPADAENVVFNNGNGGDGNQTGDIPLPETAFTAVNWNSDNRALEVTFNTSGRHIFYVKVTSTNPTVYQQVVIPIVFYVSDVEDSYYVLDYGLATQTVSATDMLKNDDFLANYGMTNAQFMGYLTSTNKPRYLGTFTSDAFAAGNINRVAYDGTILSGSYEASDGTFNLGSTAANVEVAYNNGVYSMDGGYKMSFTPDKIMDEEYSLWMAFRVYNPVVKKWNTDTNKWSTSTFTPHAIGGENASSTQKTYTIDIHNELQMLKKVTVLPATVVYYEDDFVDISYTKANGTFTKVGNGSGSLTQGVAAETPYGQDSTYQSSNNAEMSGNSLTKIKISNSDKVASFGFKGTGFELISRTNAYDSASMVVNVYSAALDTSGNIVKSGTDPLYRVPVITEFTNSSNSVCAHADHGTDGICNTCGQSVAHSYPADGTYTYQIPSKATYMIFNNGNGGGTNQTADITIADLEEGKKYTDNGGNYYIVVGADGSKTAYFEKTSSDWPTVYLYTWNDAGEKPTGDWTGTQMTALTSTACLICGAEFVAPTEYYLIGTINGAECGNSDNWKELTEYKFVDGKLTVEFTKGSYVGVKSPTGYGDVTDEDGNVTGTEPTFNWYWTTSYCTSESAILVLNGSEKMYVPSGVKVTFTLVENADGSLSLSYSSGESDRFTTTENTVVYYDNSVSKWDFVNVYYWSDSSNPVEWSGSAMTRIGTTDVYSFTLPAGVSYVIFNNKTNGVEGGEQTGDINLSSKGNIYTNGKWAIYDAETGNTTPIPEKTTTSTSSGYAINQVPVIRVDELTYGYYYVEISGMPTYDFSNATIDKNTGAVTGAVMVDTYLYIDGIRIYQPLNATHDHYYQNEDGAVFEELRDLILEGNAAVAVYEKDKQKAEGTSTIYSGNKSWTENRNGWLGENKIEYVGNQVGSIDDYMLVGPNNEAYLNGNNTNQAVIFYVTEDEAVTYHSLQIAARAIDSGLFLNGESAGVEATLYHGVVSGGSYAWKQIDTIQSGTEQYYTIDYSACPYTEDASGVKTYQIALFVRSGMVSFSSVKLTGLKVCANNLSEKTSLIYTTSGFLENVISSTGFGWNYFNATEQVKSTVFIDADEPDTTPDGEGSDNTGSGDIGSEDTENNPATGDIELVGLVTMALICVAFIALTLCKKRVD